MGLINTPITFQAIINHILHDLLDNGVLMYINNIFIYTKTIKEYDRLVLDILERLWRNNLAIAPQKYKWYIQESILHSCFSLSYIFNWTRITCAFQASNNYKRRSLPCTSGLFQMLQTRHFLFPMECRKRVKKFESSPSCSHTNCEAAARTRIFLQDVRLRWIFLWMGPPRSAYLTSCD